jgi:hypothetical protein
MTQQSRRPFTNYFFLVKWTWSDAPARRRGGFAGEKVMEINKKFDTNFPAAH